MFILAQVLGLLGLVVIIISFQVRQKKRLLRLQMFANLGFFGQYLCLGAISGCLMSFTAFLRNLLFSRCKTVPKPLVAAFVAIMITLTAISYQDPFSLLPCLATVIYTLSLSSKNLLFVRLADIAACLFYLIFNIHVGAYFGIASNLLELSSSLIGILRFDRKKLWRRRKTATRQSYRRN